MKFEIPRGWWDQVLDGNIHEADLAELGHMTLTEFRAVAYKEAELREVLVATHKVTPTVAWLQAYGSPHLPPLGRRPNLRAVDLDEDQVQMAPDPQRLTNRNCDCEGTMTHPFTCAMWGGPRVMTPAIKSWLRSRGHKID